MVKFIYLIGSLRNPEVPKLAKVLREAGHEVFDDWYAAGPEADDMWMDYERARGHTFAQALDGYAAAHVYNYDRSHLDRCGVGVLLLPAGKSGHLELGYMIGQGKPGYILLPSEPERFDVMYKFADGIFTKTEDLLNVLDGTRSTKGDFRSGLLATRPTHGPGAEGSIGEGSIEYWGTPDPGIERIRVEGLGGAEAVRVGHGEGYDIWEGSARPSIRRPDAGEMGCTPDEGGSEIQSEELDAGSRAGRDGPV